MPRKFMLHELEVMLSGVNSGTPMSELESILKGRKAVAIVRKLNLLSEEDPIMWDPEKIRPYVKHVRSELWRSPQNDPNRVEQSKQRILDYLRENTDANAPDLDNAGLAYDLSVGYAGRINEARNEAGLGEFAPGENIKPSKKQRKQRILSYLREHPEASFPDLVKAGYGHHLTAIGNGIDNLRRDADIVPNGYISGAEAADKLESSRQWVSKLFKQGKIDGIKVGKRLYVSETSVINYSK